MMRNEVNPATGTAKVKQYGWELKDKPGNLVWLSKNELLVDHTYQRTASHNRHAGRRRTLSRGQRPVGD